MQKVVIGSAMVFMLIEGVHIVALQYFSNVPSEMCWLLSYVLCASTLIDKKMTISKRTICNNLIIGINFSAIAFLICNKDYAQNLVAKIIDGSRFKAYADDPNFYSLYICLSMAILLSCRNKSKVDLIMLGTLLIIGVLTASKMCILLMLFVIFASILCQLLSKETEKKNHVFMLKTILGIIATLVIFRNNIIKFWNNLLSRAGLSNGFQSIDYARLTTGRSVILSNYLTILSNDVIALIFGYGFMYSNYLHEETNHGAHNTYLDFILSWGIIGTAVLMYFVLFLIRLYLNNREDITQFKMIDWLPLVTLLINFLDLGCMSATMFWWILTAAIMSIGDEKVVSVKETNI